MKIRIVGSVPRTADIVVTLRSVPAKPVAGGVSKVVGDIRAGGMFLKQFVDDKTPWAHLDIAGTATCDKAQPYCPKGVTGFGVRLLIDYLEHLEDRKS